MVFSMPPAPYQEEEPLPPLPAATEIANVYAACSGVAAVAAFFFDSLDLRQALVAACRTKFQRSGWLHSRSFVLTCPGVPWIRGQSLLLALSGDLGLVAARLRCGRSSEFLISVDQR
jgi:hypothetical protein